MRRTTRERKAPETFEASPTAVRGSRKAEPRRRPAAVVQSKHGRTFNKERAARRKAAREEYICMASLKTLADETFMIFFPLDLSTVANTQGCGSVCLC